MKKLGYVFLLLFFILVGCSSNSVGQNEPPKKEESTTPTENIDSVGIFSVVKDDRNSSTIDFTNGWKMEIPDENKIMLVEAGSLKSDPKQGVLIVQERRISSEEVLTEKRVLTPSKHGFVKIKITNGFNLTLEAEDKTTYLFNVFDRFR